MKTATYNKASCVVCDGPISGGCDENDEFPVWVVFLADDNGDEAGKVYTCFTYAAAVELARKMSKDRRVELVMEASAA